LIAQALINLIENALRHTPEGSAIAIGAHAEESGAMAFVRDNGRGIPEADRKRVIERFVRLEASRSTPGHGLGLSLVQAVATAHGAKLSLAGVDGGFEVALHFPTRTAQ
jgi:signal transduction histidine kinase